MKAILPVIVWGVLLFLSGPEFIQNQWECLLVMFAALVLVPKGLLLMQVKYSPWYPLSAVGLCAAYLLDAQGLGHTDLLALPYLLYAAWLTLREATEWWFLPQKQLRDLVRVFALGYWATGAFWAFCFLSAFQPIGFDPVIVSLTAAHFHVAGFVLAVVVWCLLAENSGKFNRLLGWGVLAGMPLVATGITLSKLGFPGWIEMVSGVAFVVVALAVVYQHIRLYNSQLYSKNSRNAWLIGSLCLLIGGALAAMYALRFAFPMAFFTIPNMKTWHGTLNALGFGWLVLTGWEIQQRATV